MICYLTDGTWLWFDDLADYIEQNNEWQAHIGQTIVYPIPHKNSND